MNRTNADGFRRISNFLDGIRISFKRNKGEKVRSPILMNQNKEAKREKLLTNSMI